MKTKPLDLARVGAYVPMRKNSSSGRNVGLGFPDPTLNLSLNFFTT